MSLGRGVWGNREVPPPSWKKGATWGKHGFPHGSEPKASDSRVDPPRLERGRHLANPPHERRVPERHRVALGELPDAIERVAELVGEPASDLVAVPEEAAEILHPLEVADRDPAGVRQHVGKNGDPALGQDRV